MRIAPPLTATEAEIDLGLELLDKALEQTLGNARHVPEARMFLAKIAARRLRRTVMNRLDGKIAFLSGAARGIGAETARLMVAAGARVAIGDLLDERGRETVRALGGGGAEALYVHLDVTRAADWAAPSPPRSGASAGSTSSSTMPACSRQGHRGIDRGRLGAALRRQSHRRFPRHAGGPAGAARTRAGQPPGQRHRQSVVDRRRGRLAWPRSIR